MHLHIRRADSQYIFDPGTNAEYLAHSKQQRGNIANRKRILYTEHEYSAHGEHSYEFSQVFFGKSLRHMLEDNVAIDEQEACIGEWQSRVGNSHVPAMCISIERFGLLNHLLRDINTNTRGKVLRERLRQPTNTASKIQCCTVGVGNAVDSRRGDP